MVTIGTQLGTLEILALLGRGGMGEVYRARDLKLKREVAIKILPDEFSRDPDRVSRFQREAEVLASLNHPNIAAIYDLQEANGSRFLVLELVEGETLACGTGVTASALVASCVHKFSSPVKVQVQGGDQLEVSFKEDNGDFSDVQLSGPAEFVFEGKIEI